MPRPITPAKVGLSDVNLSYINIDYFRMTSLTGGDLLSVADHLREELFYGESFKKTEYGFRAGGLSYWHKKGMRKLDVAGDCSGDALQLVYDYASTMSEQNGQPAEFTRVDYCLDVRLKNPEPKLAMRWYEDVGKKVIMSREGDTLYLGSRLSPNYGRVYDKSARYGDEAGSGSVWRFEIEAKRVQARRLSNSWRKAIDKTEHISSVISYQFRKWGIELPLRGQKPQCEIAVSEECSTTQWLRRSVAPSVARLIEAGRGNEVLQALGLTNLVQARVQMELLMMNHDRD